MRILIFILVPALIIVILALLILFLPLPHPLPRTGSSSRNLVAAVTVGVTGMLWLIALGVYSISTFRAQRHEFDSIFTTLGLQPESTAGLEQRYSGMIQGYPITAAYATAQSNHPRVLDMRVRVDTGMHAAISTDKILLDCQNCSKVVLQSPSLSEINARAENTERFAHHLDNPTFVNALEELLLHLQLPASGTRELMIQTDQLWFRVHAMTFEDQEIKRYVEALTSIAALIDTAQD